MSDQTYRGNGNHDLEDVVEGDNYQVTRLRVPGGWLYTTTSEDDRGHSMITTAFVPMPEVVKHAV